MHHVNAIASWGHEAPFYGFSCVYMLLKNPMLYDAVQFSLFGFWIAFVHSQRTIPGCTLQMKGQWESNINVWFPVMYSQKWNCYFQNRIIMFCIPVPTLISLWDNNIFPGSVCLFWCREICGLILGIYKSLIDTWMNVEIGAEAAQFPEKD